MAEAGGSSGDDGSAGGEAAVRREQRLDPVCLRRGDCCRASPGWFAPGEAEGAAAFLGLALGEFVRRFLVLESVRVGAVRVEVWAPVKVDDRGQPLEGPNVRVSRVYRFMRGACVFYDEASRACRIHAVRPLECRRYFCAAPEMAISKEELGRMWIEAARGGTENGGGGPSSGSQGEAEGDR